MGHSHKAWNKPDYYFRTQVGPQLSELGSQTQLPNYDLGEGHPLRSDAACPISIWSRRRPAARLHPAARRPASAMQPR